MEANENRMTAHGTVEPFGKYRQLSIASPELPRNCIYTVKISIMNLETRDKQMQLLTTDIAVEILLLFKIVWVFI